MSSPLLTLGTADLRDHLRSGEVSSLEVTNALLDRIEALQIDVAPMTHVFPVRARRAARAADDRRAKGRAFGPYDGVPITLKESLATEGDELTMGIPARKGTHAHADGVVGRLVRESGCVVLGKTNVSQAMFFHESRNPLFGQTTNPWDQSRTPGGSSGGEAAAIAGFGSPGGFGTDIGGSIRVPAHFCGICGLKPTVDRISNLGNGGAIPGQETIRGQVGPMARTVRDLIALLDIVSPERSAGLDPRVPELPLGDVDGLRPEALRVGFYDNDHAIVPSAAVMRAVREAAAHLEAAGCEVVPFDPPMVEDVLFTYLAALSADGGQTIRGALDGGEIDRALTLLLQMVRLPPRARKALALGLGVAGERIASRMVESLGERSVAELWQVTARARQLQADVFSTWKHHKLDAVICPPHATVALPHGLSRDYSIGGAACFRYNLLDFPAGVVPVTTVRGDETTRGHTRERHDRRGAGVDAGSKGLPVGVQVVALPRREDVCLRLMGLIEAAASQAEGFPDLAGLMNRSS